MFVLASVTESIVNETSHLVRTGGLPVIFALMAVSSACIPIPSEVVMLFAGFAVADPAAAGVHHHMTLTGIVLAGLLGTMIGSWASVTGDDPSMATRRAEPQDSAGNSRLKECGGS